MKNTKHQQFYLASLRDTLGGNMSFHSLEHSGYHTDIRKAQPYSRDQAQQAWENGRSFDLPVSKFWVDSLAVYHVDHQYIPTATKLVDGEFRYVGYMRGQYEGNDVFWLCDGYKPVRDFSSATVYDIPDQSNTDVVWLPHSMVDAVKRPTFALRLLDRRSMIQHCGLKQPDWVRKERRRKSASNNVRWNCPGCGQLHWQLNPYSFDGCRNPLCSSYAP